MDNCVNFFENKSIIGSDLIREAYELNINLKLVLILNKSCFTTIIPKEEYFNLHTESSSMIDLIYNKASLKDVSLIYTHENSIPNCILGDKSLNLLIIKSLIEYGIDNSSKAAKLYLDIRGSNDTTQEIGVEYKLTFQSDLINQQDINDTFLNMKNPFKTRSLEIFCKPQSSVMFLGVILEILKGKIIRCDHVTKKKRFIISVYLPIIPSDKHVDSKFVFLHTNPEIINDSIIE